MGLGGLYGATTLATSPFSFAAPIPAPDVTKCGPADLPPGATPTNCCPRDIDYKLSPRPTRLRIRPAAHLAYAAYVAKFNRAVQLMRDLSEDDPRSFKQQANVHCDGAYHQVGFPDLELQVRESWLFFPFHRYYLYFFERILGKLIDDPTFAMPFWNNDAPAGMSLPSIYTNPNSALYDPLRERVHQPPSVVDLNYNGSDLKITPEQLINRNLTVMYRQMVSNSKTARLFFGSPYRRSEDPNPGSGSIENIPHKAITRFIIGQVMPEQRYKKY